MELEVFVHGALCIAYSGRCLLSGYFNHRDANQGTCTNSCRWDYKVDNAIEDGTGHIEKIDFDFDKALSDSALSDCGSQPRHPEADKVYVISRQDHPGELMPVLEDEHGTYIMNSKDLRAVEHVEKLAKIGIDSLKVEGRTKSIYYVARTAQVYRQAIDDAVAGRPFNLELLGALDALANRGYTDGFYERHHTHEQQNYMRGHSESFRQQYVGDIVACANGMAEIDVKNKFSVGDKLEIIHPAGNSIVELKEMRSMEGSPIVVAPGSGHRVRIPLQGELSKGMVARFV
jgi:putative protease